MNSMKMGTHCIGNRDVPGSKDTAVKTKNTPENIVRVDCIYEAFYAVPETLRRWGSPAKRVPSTTILRYSLFPNIVWDKL